jgi:hypothetical protein
MNYTIVKVRHIHIYDDNTANNDARILSVVECVLICKDTEHLEKTFKDQAKLEGIEVTKEDMNNGYVATKNGSICMSCAKEAQ